MACITLLAPPIAVTTTQLARAIHHEAAAPWQIELNLQQRNILRLSWVLVTDSDGSRRLRMQWASADDE